MTFDELYSALLKSAAGPADKAHQKLLRAHKNKSGIDCLLRPERYAPVWQTDQCTCGGSGAQECVKSCIFSAIRRDKTGALIIDKERCTGCAACIDACASGKLTASRDVLPVLDALKNSGRPVYALVAPAIAGQFQNASLGKLRSAFKAIGFVGMVEVALFADILTLKEALTFDAHIRTDEDFMLASCCCPIWIAMVRQSFSQYMKKMPDAVSPMVACGRAVKRLEPAAVTVFIGPCLAKKAEAREKDIADAVDHVLTFEETRDILEAFRIDFDTLAEDKKEHSSRAGRIYGRTGGVSAAVGDTVRQLNPYRHRGVIAVQADGTKSCRELLEALREGRLAANYLEGMGCESGCAGGPKVLVGRELGAEHIDAYGEKAAFKSPLDNPYVPEVLRNLGIDSIEALLDETIFTRRFEDVTADSRR